MEISHRKQIRYFANGYRQFHKVIYDYENGLNYCDAEELRRTLIDMGRIESAINHLSEQDYFIIYNEVQLGRSGNWYLEYFSESTYRRRCKTAYANFIKFLNK